VKRTEQQSNKVSKYNQYGLPDRDSNRRFIALEANATTIITPKKIRFVYINTELKVNHLYDNARIIQNKWFYMKYTYIDTFLNRAGF